MTVRRIQVTDFRCLRSAELTLDPQFTLISGPNASGKTSVLEAIYMLGRGRSFRTRRLQTLIRSGAERFILFGEVNVADRLERLGLEGTGEGVRGRVNGASIGTLGELAAALPVQIIDPEVHRLIEEGPGQRRRFLDWGVFHVEHQFVDHWQRFQRVLKQRNAGLKAREPSALVDAWDGEFIRLGTLIHEARNRYCEQLRPAAVAVTQRLLGLELGMTYRPGWPRELGLEEALRASRTHDADAGSTQVGPQRADIVLRLQGTPVKDRISRGQQKLLAAALLLAQLHLFTVGGARRPTLLLDDPAAELDGDRLFGLIDEVARQPLQLVVTSLQPEFTALGTPAQRYRIDAGTLRAE